MADLPVNITKFGMGVGSDNATAAVGTNSLSTIIHLSAGYSSYTQNAFFPFQKAGVANAQYQVTTGKTLYVLSAHFTANTAGSGILMGYSTATFTENNTSAPTGIVYYAGSSSGISAFSGPTANTQVSLPQLVGMKFPALSYPLLKYLGASTNTFSMTMVCVEL